MTPKTAFMIAAPSSGSGKTTIARGLMALLTEKGKKVQPFKCGPDYIDTKFHQKVCGRPSVNLDTFMASEEHVKTLFEYYSNDADISIVEGMMGLFDGYDRDKGSSAEIARVLSIPIVLVVDAKSAAYSMAAQISGFLNFRKDIRISGVIFNKVGSQNHFKMLQQVCDDLQITCFGYLPKNLKLDMESRYLGLDFTRENDLQVLLKFMEEYVDWEGLSKLEVSREETGGLDNTNYQPHQDKRHVMIAHNEESFSFIYQEMIDRFEHVSFFDPENDVPRLRDVDLLYLPGGYPEKHLHDLVRNEPCRSAIKDYANSGGKVFAECGGMMYLCEKIVTDDGSYPMCDALPYNISALQNDRKLSLGYRRVEIEGQEYRGHEFHYTQFHGELPRSYAQVFNAKGEMVQTPIFRFKNILASYTHLYQIPSCL